MKIGLLGGTFDPLHLGHLHFAERAAGRFALDRIYFVPAARPWHKGTSASYADRYAMVAVALIGHENWQPLDLSEEELSVEGMSFTYSIDQVAAVLRKHPESQLVFLLGADSLLEIHTWKDYVHLLDLCDFAVAPRSGITTAEVAQRLPRGVVQSVREDEIVFRRTVACWLTGFDEPISSSALRARLAQLASKGAASVPQLSGGDDPLAYLPQAVVQYIARAGLYQQPASSSASHEQKQEGSQHPAPKHWS